MSSSISAASANEILLPDLRLQLSSRGLGWRVSTAGTRGLLGICKAQAVALGRLRAFQASWVQSLLRISWLEEGLFLQEV